MATSALCGTVPGPAVPASAGTAGPALAVSAAAVSIAAGVFPLAAVLLMSAAVSPASSMPPLSSLRPAVSPWSCALSSLSLSLSLSLVTPLLAGAGWPRLLLLLESCTDVTLPLLLHPQPPATVTPPLAGGLQGLVSCEGAPVLQYRHASQELSACWPLLLRDGCPLPLTKKAALHRTKLPPATAQPGFLSRASVTCPGPWQPPATSPVPLCQGPLCSPVPPVAAGAMVRGAGWSDHAAAPTCTGLTPINRW